ncbi:MAG TPA: MarR family transcriptional regulator [Ilumatobacteraceae bacterium]|jgi:DNA-binding MarR family transcriptional regulator|nr:MarR family transcriptional regulator [Ilumatobacteraceae bacterium]
MSSEIEPPAPLIGYSLRVVWQWIWAENFQAVVRAGYDDVTPAHVSLFRYPGLDGYRMTDIAQRMQITKQSVHELIGHLETLEYLVREPDPSNRRARLVRLTPKGRRLQDTIRAQAQEAERQVAGIVGQRRFDQLQEALDVLVREITASRPCGATSDR